jgi:hypothetical protein
VGAATVMEETMATKPRGPLMRTTPDALDVIASRHTPSMVAGVDDDSDVRAVLICSRDEELWPCDARQLLDRLGVERPPGAKRGALDYTNR